MGEQVRVSSEDNHLIAKTWQLAIKVNGNLITLIEVNLKTIVLKLLGDLADKSLVWLEAIKLVDYSCFRLSEVIRRWLVYGIDTRKGNDASDRQGYSQPDKPRKAAYARLAFSFLLSLEFSQCLASFVLLVWFKLSDSTVYFATVIHSKDRNYPILISNSV